MDFSSNNINNKTFHNVYSERIKAHIVFCAQPLFPNMQRFLCAALILLCSVFWLHGAGQERSKDLTEGSLIRGRLVMNKTEMPAIDVQLVIPALKLLVSTDGDGRFFFSRVPIGIHTIIVGGQIVRTDTLNIDVHNSVADLGNITVYPNDTSSSMPAYQIPTLTFDDNNEGVENGEVPTSKLASPLIASRDPFQSATAFVFSVYRFRPRGFDRSSQEVQINGAPMNDVETGGASWAQWGGLNDAFRNRSNTYGLHPSGYTFGGNNGSVYFDATALGQQKQTRITYSLSNRSYRNRIMFTKSSGLTTKGWAYSFSVSRRWAKEGYVPGTFYDGYAYYAGLSKQFKGGKHELHLTTFGSTTRRGKAAPVTLEAVEITDDKFYNPNWGYQNGEKRNARIADNFQPLTILNYEYRPSHSLRWETSLGYQFGKTRNSALDYYNGTSPRPDYYRYMPSYYVLNGLDPALARFNTSQQIEWNDLYNVNYNNYDSVKDANGIAGHTVYGRRSVFVLYNDVDDIRKFSFNTNVEKVFNEHVTLASGIQAITQQTESYRQMVDLLGGDYYLNLNQFAKDATGQNFAYNQYDINTPNRIVKEGDKYNYDYITRFTRGAIWAQIIGNFNKADLFLSARVGYSDFSRDGLFRNGLFPYASYGKGDVLRFTTYDAKGGVTYKVDGRNFLFVNAGLTEDAPTVENTYISPRTRAYSVPDPKVEATSSIEAGYLMRTPKYNLRAVGYATDIKDAVEVRRYYSDFSNSFISYVMAGVNSRHTGLELAAEVKLTSTLAVTGVTSISQTFYTDNPSFVGLYGDNDSASTPVMRQVYIKNYYVAVGPQSAYSLGFNYRSRKFWYASTNFNYFDRNYISISPDQRSNEAIAGVPVGSELYNAILDQQALPPLFTLDASVGTSILLSKYTKNLPRSSFLYVNMGISNVLDAEVRTGGFEQLRYDFENVNPGKFGNKYFYGFGRNFFINLSLKF